MHYVSNVTSYVDRGNHEVAADSMSHDRADAMRPICVAGVGTTETAGDLERVKYTQGT